MPFKYITREDLAAIIKSDKIPRKDYCIIDVRDDDWQGGNIKGALNSPSHSFVVRVNQLVEEFKDVPLLVFHCAMSQARGPKAAKIYVKTRLRRHGNVDGTTNEVMVLLGGFAEFQSKFRDDPQLVEN